MNKQTKTIYAHNQQMHDEAVKRCQNDAVLYYFALKLFNDLTTNKDTWNYFVNFYNKQVIEYVTDMFNNDFFVYDGNDVECVVEQLYDFLDNWNVNWYHED